MKHTRAHVTDHAVMRYLERVLHVDIDAYRREICELVGPAAAQGASGVVVNGMSYRIKPGDNGPVVVTVRPAKSLELRRGRKPRRRGGGSL